VLQHVREALHTQIFFCERVFKRRLESEGSSVENHRFLPVLSLFDTSACFFDRFACNYPIGLYTHNTQTRMHAYMHTRTHTHTHAHAYTRRHTHERTHTNKRTHVQQNTHTYIVTHTHTHTHIHRHIQTTHAQHTVRTHAVRTLMHAHTCICAYSKYQLSYDMYVIYHVTDFSNHYISADDKAASISLIRSHHRQEIVNSSPQNAQLQGCVYYIHTEMMVLTETYIHTCTHTYILCHEYIRHAHIQTYDMQTYQQTY